MTMTDNVLVKAVTCRMLGPDGEHYWPSTEHYCRYCGYRWDKYQETHNLAQAEAELERIAQLDRENWAGWSFEGDKPWPDQR